MLAWKVDTYLNNFQFMSGAGSVEDCYLRGGNTKNLTIVKVKLYNVNLLPRDIKTRKQFSRKGKKYFFPT